MKLEEMHQIARKKHCHKCYKRLMCLIDRRNECLTMYMEIKELMRRDGYQI